MTVTAQQLDQARRLARETARRGRPLETCPWPVTGTPDQRRLALAFIREWSRGQADPTDYTT